MESMHAEIKCPDVNMHTVLDVTRIKQKQRLCHQIHSLLIIGGFVEIISDQLKVAPLLRRRYFLKYLIFVQNFFLHFGKTAAIIKFYTFKSIAIHVQIQSPYAFVTVVMFCLKSQCQNSYKPQIQGINFNVYNQPLFQKKRKKHTLVTSHVYYS